MQKNLDNASSMHRDLESCAHNGMPFYDLEIEIFSQISIIALEPDKEHPLF